MRKKRFISKLLQFVLILSMLNVGAFTSEGATVTKNGKTYEIAVVFDNSGSMYDNQAWCRAKYAMEIFASMLHYENGDVLKIFPMWAVTTDGSKPATGGSLAEIDIKNRNDINKISNLYTVEPSGTPYAPVTEAYNALRSSAAAEKWLVVLTDGEFNQEARKEPATIDLQSRLPALATNGIKVQYLGIGSAATLNSDESKSFYAKKSTESSLKEDLISICNTIFQRSVLPAKYINGNTVTLDISMKSLIVFAQGANAKINSLTDSNGNKINVTLDSGQRKFSTVNAGGQYVNAPVDNTLAGQVVTFAACPKGTYTLDYSGAEAVQIFYEPDVDINIALTNSDGENVDYSAGISADTYKLSYGLVDAVTGEDVTSSELMGNDVKLTGSIVTSDGTATEVKNGDSVELVPDSATNIIVEGTYLKDYTISTKDDPQAFPPIEVKLPELQEFVMTASTQQPSSWYHTRKHDQWKPIRLDMKLAGAPLTDEQLNTVKPVITFSKDMTYTCKPVAGQSAYEVYIGVDEAGTYTAPAIGEYNMKASASLPDKYGQEMVSESSIDFTVQRYSAMWRWLKWIVLLLIIIAIIVFILTRKTWPKDIYVSVNGENAQRKQINGNTISFDAGQNRAKTVLTLKKNSPLYKRSKRSASVQVTGIKMQDRYAERYYVDSCTFTKKGSKFTDEDGNAFGDIYGKATKLIIRSELEIEVHTKIYNNLNTIPKKYVFNVLINRKN